MQIKEKARLSQQDAYRSSVILDTSQLLQKAATQADILSCTARQLNKLLKRDITCFEQDGAGPVSYTHLDVYKRQPYPLMAPPVARLVYTVQASDSSTFSSE